jgi:hypothetical protein
MPDWIKWPAGIEKHAKKYLPKPNERLNLVGETRTSEELKKGAGVTRKQLLVALGLPLDDQEEADTQEEKG